jgi:flavin-dependent dehydrogenase
MSNNSTQVLVVGGGPGGSTSAALLAKQGFKVVLVEREQLPRYHIGESLLPSCLRIFDLLGIREKIEGYGFQRKDGGYFDWGGQKWEVEFGTPTKPLYGFQVVRSEFDKLLLDHAKSVGAEVLQGVEVKELSFKNGRPVAAHCVGPNGLARQINFEVLVDASGRTGLMATRYLRNRKYHKVFKNVAVWGYWDGAKRLTVGPFGAIATCSIPYGWIWAIPLHDGTLSVGIVLHHSRFKSLNQYFELEEIYRTAITSSEVVSGLVGGGELRLPLRVETDYSYAAERFSGPGYYLVGDAACFLDPLLSTGVHLATFSALVAAAAVSSTLTGEIDETDAHQFYSESYRRAYLRMMVVVSSFYQTHRGRDAHFRQAQSLTRHDYSDSELIAAFLNIISGVEDLKDIEEGESHVLLESLTKLYEDHYSFIRERDIWGTMSLDEINKGMDRLKVVGAVQEEFSLTPETAINGIFVMTEPKLGLKRVEAFAARSVGNPMGGTNS